MAHVPALQRLEGAAPRTYPRHHTFVQIAALAWAHSVIGLGFFILQVGVRVGG